MRFNRLHAWTDDVQEAERLLEQFAPQVSTKVERTSFRLVGGVDVAYSKRDTTGFATVVVMKVPEMELVEKVRAQQEITFPFVPGLFYFREGPVIMRALSRLKICAGSLHLRWTRHRPSQGGWDGIDDGTDSSSADDRLCQEASCRQG